MNCIVCQKEHLHDPGDFHIVDVEKLRPTGWRATIYRDGQPLQSKIVEIKSDDRPLLQDVVHIATNDESLHWHWPGDKKSVFAGHGGGK